MQCPQGDGELHAHTTIGENKLLVHYSTCPVCDGYFMESFAANYIKLPPHAEKIEPGVPTRKLSCPVCQQYLVRASGTNIPEGSMIFMCPAGHGYFFPKGQLAAWKEAQAAKLTYHKLWHLPLPSIASVLLTTLLVAGLIVSYRAVQTRQTITPQARQTISLPHAYPSPGLHEVLITVSTQEPLAVSVHIPSLNNFAKRMETENGRVHSLLVKDVPPGDYRYYFTWETGGRTVTSDSYTFVMK